MDVKTQLKALYELQQLDSVLDALKRQYAGLDRGQAEQALYDSAKAAHTEAKAALTAASAALRDLELEQKAVETKRAGEEERLYSGKVRAPKELQALQEEVEALKRQRERLDERLLTLMDDLEGCRTNESQAKKELVTATAALRERVTAFNAQAETMKAQAQALAAQRSGSAKVVPADLLKRYDTLRAGKGGVALAPLTDGNLCGGCKMGLPSSIVVRVHEGKSFVLCDNCGRMLCEGS
jgi:predicted  nucleic acid-binding Zn-ribbon protein